MGRSFTTAIKAADDELHEVEYPYFFDLDGEEIRYRDPTEGEALMLSASMGRHVPNAERLGTVIDLFTRVLDPKQKDDIIFRILDPDDDLGSKQLFGTKEDPVGILQDMLEEWSGRPTKR